MIAMYSFIPALTTSTCQNIKIVTKAWGNEVSWTFGSCQGPSGGSYSNYDEHDVQCCLAGGSYTLNCKDSYGDGWHGGYIEIGGTRYCETFLAGSTDGHLQTHTIMVAGTSGTQQAGKKIIDFPLFGKLFSS